LSARTDDVIMARIGRLGVGGACDTCSRVRSSRHASSLFASVDV
jgi:hypothetical protein